VSDDNPTSDWTSYTCKWRTATTFDGCAQNGEIQVKARSMSHAIGVAKQKIYEQYHLGTKHVVVYEVEEPFL
jgi:hypothetical protein